MLRVTSAMAVSSAAVVAFGVVRSKLVAVHLGPHGVGTLAILLSFVTVAALVLGCGTATSAIREIALAQSQSDRVGRDDLRRALYAFSAGLGIAGGVATVLLAAPIASVLGDRSLEGDVRWAAVGVTATVIGSAVLADLNGFRRIRVLALAQPAAALIATAAAVVAWLAGFGLIPVVLIAPPLALLAVAALAAMRTLPPIGATTPFTRLRTATRKLLWLGIAFLLDAAFAAVGALLLRLLIENRLGLTATGEFQAAFAIATYYLMFIFGALITDYLPLLSGAAEDESRLAEVANSQLAVAVIISAPVVMILIAAAPAIVPLLYSGAFGETTHLLRIMLVGELTRVASWTIGYILVARSARLLFVTSELVYNALLLALAVALIPGLGISGAAVAYLICQVASLLWTLAFVWWAANFRMSGANVLILLGSGAAAGSVYAAAVAGGPGPPIAWVIAVLSSLVAGWWLARMHPALLSPLTRFLGSR